MLAHPDQPSIVIMTGSCSKVQHQCVTNTRVISESFRPSESHGMLAGWEDCQSWLCDAEEQYKQEATVPRHPCHCRA